MNEKLLRKAFYELADAKVLVREQCGIDEEGKPQDPLQKRFILIRDAHEALSLLLRDIQRQKR